MTGTQGNPRKRKILSNILAVIPPIGNYSSRREWENVCWQNILQSEKLFELLATSHERHNLVMRAAAIRGIILGESYRHISKKLFLSLQTISGIKKAIIENSYKSYLERSKKERKRKKYSTGISFKPKYKGRPIRTKHGTLHVPY